MSAAQASTTALPRVGDVLVGRVSNLRLRSKFLFFCSLDVDGEVHELMLKSVSAPGTPGVMDDAEVAALKRSLRAGDELSAEIHWIEPVGDKAAMHVRAARILNMRIASNTGVERTVAVPGLSLIHI